MRLLLLAGSTAGLIMGAQGVTLYVSPCGNDADTGLLWRCAKQTIQAAIEATQAGDEIIVTNGTYTPIVANNRSIRIESVNGPAVTIIDGGDTNTCAILGTLEAHPPQHNTTLCGFTLTNGNAHATYCDDPAGGGASGGTLSNCVLIANRAEQALKNPSPEVIARIKRRTCGLSGFDGGGGGASESRLFDCKLINNVAENFGGGAKKCELIRCTLIGNQAANGNGAMWSTLQNSLLKDNGAYSCELTNCTVVSTHPTGDRANSVRCGSLHNTIVWVHANTNDAKDVAAESHWVRVVNSCFQTSEEHRNGLRITNCISQPPQFVNAAAGDYRLLPDSPCVGAGDAGFTNLLSGLDGLPLTDTNGRTHIGAFGVVPLAELPWRTRLKYKLTAWRAASSAKDAQ